MTAGPGSGAPDRRVDSSGSSSPSNGAVAAVVIGLVLVTLWVVVPPLNPPPDVVTGVLYDGGDIGAGEIELRMGAEISSENTRRIVISVNDSTRRVLTPPIEARQSVVLDASEGDTVTVTWVAPEGDRETVFSGTVGGSNAS